MYIVNKTIFICEQIRIIPTGLKHIHRQSRVRQSWGQQVCYIDNQIKTNTNNKKWLWLKGIQWPNNK